MSDPSKKPAVTESVGATAELGRQQPSSSVAFKVWATIGAVFLAYTVYVFVRWVTGPYFESVSGGPSEPPMYMQIPLMINAIVLWIGLPFALWYFLIRPWVRERRITLDGMLLVSMGLMMFQDPMLNYY
ncbi:MAG: spirocyclase AveC family protein, partial [Mycobacterium sp.]